MEILEVISEERMVATFLRGEIDSDRWEDRILGIMVKYGIDRKVVDQPDLSDPVENGLRKLILGKFRGFGQNEFLFEGFPKLVDWKRVIFNRQELEEIRYMNFGYWVEISGGTRKPKILAEKIVNKQYSWEREDIKSYLQMARVWESGAKPPELIVVGSSLKSEWVLLEGHVRLTGYFLARIQVAEELEVILGISKEMEKWRFC